MATYQSFIDLADKMIRAKGASATLTRPGDTGFDPVTQTATPDPDAATVRAVGFPPSRQAEHHIGSLVGRTVMEFYIALKSQTIVPSPGDLLRWAGVEYRVIWSQTYDPAGDGAIFTLAYGER